MFGDLLEMDALSGFGSLDDFDWDGFLGGLADWDFGDIGEMFLDSETGDFVTADQIQDIMDPMVVEEFGHVDDLGPSGFDFSEHVDDLGPIDWGHVDDLGPSSWDHVDDLGPVQGSDGMPDWLKQLGKGAAGLLSGLGGTGRGLLSGLDGGGGVPSGGSGGAAMMGAQSGGSLPTSGVSIGGPTPGLMGLSGLMEARIPSVGGSEGASISRVDLSGGGASIPRVDGGDSSGLGIPGLSNQGALYQRDPITGAMVPVSSSVAPLERGAIPEFRPIQVPMGGPMPMAQQAPAPRMSGLQRLLMESRRG